MPKTVLSSSFFPFVVSYDAPANAVNVSSLLDAPAGRHGFVRAVGDHFETDAGPIRFNGINLTGPANFPDREHAARMADRLARFGFNCVRLHYMDADYGNFMQPPARCLVEPSGETEFAFRADRLDRLDFLVAELKRRGIYVYLNLHVARLMKRKGETWLAPELIASEKEYARRLLTHVNPYTGLAWADDPVVALVELNNEDAVYDALPETKGTNWWRRTEIQRRFAPQILPYLHEMARFLKDDLGVRAPIAGTQVDWSSKVVQAELDFVDTHDYWCHPSPVNANWTITDAPMVNYAGGPYYSPDLIEMNRCPGKPYTVSEACTPYPNAYGAEGLLLLRAYAAALGWNGLFFYTYSNVENDEPDHVEYFFSAIARTDVLAHLPAAANLMLCGNGETTTLEVRDGYCVCSTPQTRFFAGFVRHRAFDLGGGFSLFPGETEHDWLALSLTETAPGRLLIAATAMARNHGAKTTVHRQNGEGYDVVSTRGEDWGSGPFEVEGVTARLLLPGGCSRAWALDERGERRMEIPVRETDGGMELLISSAYRTVWYEVQTC